jgi:hypothetical protein
MPKAGLEGRLKRKGNTMLLKKDFEIIAAHGMWANNKRSTRMVAVLEGTAHSFQDMDFVRSVFCRKSKSRFDVYRLQKGWKIKR